MATKHRKRDWALKASQYTRYFRRFRDSMAVLEKLSPGSVADRSENARSAVFSRASLHFRQFLLWNQERGESCTRPPPQGVMTPWQLPRLSPRTDITSFPDCLAHCLMKPQTTCRKRVISLEFQQTYGYVEQIDRDREKATVNKADSQRPRIPRCSVRLTAWMRQPTTWLGTSKLGESAMVAHTGRTSIWSGGAPVDGTEL
jgi:hypothetical protein